MLAEALLAKARYAKATPEQLQVLKARVDAVEPSTPAATDNATRVAEELGLSVELGWL